MTRTRLLLVDDHTLFRESLGRLLSAEPDCEIAGECGTAVEALEFLGRTKLDPQLDPKLDPRAEPQVDLVLLDFHLPDLPGDEVVRQARGCGHAAKILIVTGAIDEAQSCEVLKLGASGIFLKHNPASMLLRAIRVVAAGDAWLDPKVIQLLTARTAVKRDAIARSAFSEREMQVMAAVVEGLTNGRIAARLGLTEGAVKSTVQQLFEKTNVRTRSQLVRFTVESPPGKAGV